MEIVMTMCDLHVPYHDIRAIDVALQLAKHVKPEILILHEVNDFYAVSKFNKDPERKLKLQDELDMSYQIRKRIRLTLPDTRIIELNSNHTKRLKKYLNAKAEELSYLRCLRFEELAHLNELDIEFMESFTFRNILFKHGDIVRKESGYTAKAEFLKEGMSGASGHCFSEDTEILTYRGWITHDKLDMDNDVVGTRNKKTGKLEWNKINAIYRYDDYDEMYHIKGQTVDLLVTDKHGILYKNRLGLQRETTADNLPDEFFIYNSCKPETTKTSLNESWLRLFINFLADGSIEQGSVRWHLKKERKINHLIDILDGIGNMVYSCHKQKTGTTKIRLSVKSSKDLLYWLDDPEIKEMPDWLSCCNHKEAMIILNEYSITDGCKNSAAKNSYQLSSFKDGWLDILQELFICNGMRATRNKHTLTVNSRNGIRLTRDNNVSVVPYSGKVWCVNVDNGTLIVRRNGKACVTLNTHRLGMYFKRLRGGKYVWLESGCLCQLEADYIEGTADWQQGVSMFMFEDRSLKFQPKVIPIIDYTILWGNNLFKG